MRQVKDKELEVNPFLLGLDASAFVLKSISDVRASDVEQALLLLPFTDALRLLSFLPIWLSKRTNVSLLIVKMASCLLWCCSFDPALLFCSQNVETGL